MDKRIIRYFAIAIPIVSSLVLTGLLKPFFDADVNTNLFNTGITVGFILGGLNLGVAYIIYKNLM